MQVPFPGLLNQSLWGGGGGDLELLEAWSPRSPAQLACRMTLRIYCQGRRTPQQIDIGVYVTLVMFERVTSLPKLMTLLLKGKTYNG